MKAKANVSVALFLILVGAWFMAVELSPALKAIAYGAKTWPLQIVGVGALLGLLALVTWSPGFWIPGAIIAGIGGLLYWQNWTGNWGSWAYAWTLIPGFVGIGILLFGLFARRGRAVVAALWLIFNSLVLFAIFGAFLGGPSTVLRLWPALVIVLGLVVLFSALFRRR